MTGLMCSSLWSTGVTKAYQVFLGLITGSAVLWLEAESTAIWSYLLFFSSQLLQNGAIPEVGDMTDTGMRDAATQGG